mmetsp:Transcript_58237/g.182798  ORF Transcript_58237/g.182798 Transcript_58237/m.182798 type:complete len:233 (+) Transcript_58237:415-1113(+)
MCSRFLPAVMAWNFLTLSRPPSTCCLAFSNSVRAVSAAPAVSRPTSVIFTSRNLSVAESSPRAVVTAFSMVARCSPRSSGVMVSSPMRKGVSESRILFRMSSMSATFSVAALKIGMAAARAWASSIVFDAFSSKACAASARAMSSSSLVLMPPLTPLALPWMSRMVGVSDACASRMASLASLTSAGPASSGFRSRALARGSDITAAFSASISTPARRVARSPKSFSAARASS